MRPPNWTCKVLHQHFLPWPNAYNQLVQHKHAGYLIPRPSATHHHPPTHGLKLHQSHALLHIPFTPPSPQVVPCSPRHPRGTDLRARHPGAPPGRCRPGRRRHRSRRRCPGPRAPRCRRPWTSRPATSLSCGDAVMAPMADFREGCSCV